MNVEIPTIFPAGVIAGLVFDTNLDFKFDSTKFDSSIKQLSKYLKTDKENLVLARQVHKDTIFVVDEMSVNNLQSTLASLIKNQEADQSSKFREFYDIEADSIITNQKNMTLVIRVADCCCGLIYDPITGAIGAFHSGRKGTELNIAGKTIDKMNKKFGSSPPDLLVYLTSCINQKNYQVSKEIAEDWPIDFKEQKNQKFYLNIRARIKNQLVNCGMKEDNIEISKICTFENEAYHSYRRQNQNYKLMAGFITVN